MMLYILTGINAERDTAAKKEPVRGNKMNHKLSILGPKVIIVCKTGFYPTFSYRFFYKETIIEARHVTIFNPEGCFYPKMARKAQIPQVNRPGVCSILVITVWWQWGHTVCPGASCSAALTITWVTEDSKYTSHKIEHLSPY